MSKARLIGGLVVLVALAVPGCSDGGLGPGPGEPRPTDLLTDAQLHVPLEAGAPVVTAAWADWVAANHHPVRSLTSSDYSDLQFLKPLIGNRRLVQLGESTHGAREFNMAKVRLVKFLHEEMGFDVIAFESGLADCYLAEREARGKAPTAIMRECVYGVWLTRELEPLFEVVSRTSGRRLTLAGFDIKMSSRSLMTRRPQLFRDALTTVDAQLARSVHDRDSTFLAFLYSGTAPPYIEQHGAREAAWYDTVATAISSNAAAITAAHPTRPELAAVAARAARNQADHLRSLIAPSATAIRDPGMADNITFLLDTLYPGRKVIVWAHNAHVRHTTTAGSDPALAMGYHLAQRHRSQMYTVGFFMAAGESVVTSREQPSPVVRPFDHSLEAVLLRTQRRHAFVDMLHQANSQGTTWMFDQIRALNAGMFPYFMRLREHFDALFYVHTTQSPEYLQ